MCEVQSLGGSSGFEHRSEYSLCVIQTAVCRANLYMHLYA